MIWFSLQVDPECNTPIFRGSWSVYPYFASGTIVLTSIERGETALCFASARSSSSQPFPFRHPVLLFPTAFP